MSWFEVDKGGLRQLLEGRDKSFIIRELVQNAWDEPGVTYCKVTLAPVSGRPVVELVVEDDAPEGFYDLRHAFTLFAHTRKRADAEKRGRYNMGEKEVLALCQEAEIITTTGHVRFKADGNRTKGRSRREAGSLFRALVRLTRPEYEECCQAIRTFIPPKGIATSFNGENLQYREPLAQVPATLLTEFENGDGILRQSKRKTTINIYEPLEDEDALIYEMGLPIIETGDRWHYNIQQRVPLTMDRNNVRPSFLQDVRAEVANAMADELEDEDASEAWVRSASSDLERIKPETVQAIADKRWGDKRVVADPTDPQSRERAIAAGFHIVSPREMSKEEWAAMREAKAVPSSSSLFPTKFGESEQVPAEDLTEDHYKIAALVKRVAYLALGIEVGVGFFRQAKGHSATYGQRHVDFNLSQLGERWFKPDNLKAQLELIIHELGHEGGGHVEEGYYRMLSKIGAKLALTEPEKLEG